MAPASPRTIIVQPKTEAWPLRQPRPHKAISTLLSTPRRHPFTALACNWSTDRGCDVSRSNVYAARPMTTSPVGRSSNQTVTRSAPRNPVHRPHPRPVRRSGVAHRYLHWGLYRPVGPVPSRPTPRLGDLAVTQLRLEAVARHARGPPARGTPPLPSPARARRRRRKRSSQRCPPQHLQPVLVRSNVRRQLTRPGVVM